MLIPVRFNSADLEAVLVLLGCKVRPIRLAVLEALYGRLA